MARIMVVRESQNHDSLLVNFLEHLDPLDKLVVGVNDIEIVSPKNLVMASPQASVIYRAGEVPKAFRNIVTKLLALS